ncbi:MAG: response regulator [Butyrivibrio sp.]|nr:response regulator [Muribaculum sp.]MCM1552785.1 response regulator [Butyrivibrio sp.]
MSEFLIIQKTKSYVSNSLLEQLRRENYSVDLVDADINKLNINPNETKALILYLDPAFVQDSAVLEYIRDILSDGYLCFAAGDEEELLSLKKIISKRKLAKEFMRPLNVSEAVQEMKDALCHGLEKPKEKILVVDDSAAMLRNVKGWLKDKYEVILANSGEFAMKYLASELPDLILLDYEMPGMDGKEVLSAIRSNQRTKELPVIFLTGKGAKQDVVEVMSLKPEGYILKTEEPQKIVQRIDEFFEKEI